MTKEFAFVKHIFTNGKKKAGCTLMHTQDTFTEREKC